MSAFVLAGLRVKRNVALNLFKGVRAMRESDTYLAIMDEGREDQMRFMIRRAGKRKFSEPDEQILTHLEGITDLDRLVRIFDRVMEATSWQDLLATP